MWDLYGRDDFAEILQIEVCHAPTANNYLIVHFVLGVFHSRWQVHFTSLDWNFVIYCRNIYWSFVQYLED